MAKDELRQRAFDIWYEAGCNYVKAAAALRAAGYVVSRQSLASWSRADDWKGRAARVDAQKFAANDARLLTEDQQVLSLMRAHKKTYEDYIAKRTKPDSQITYAYLKVLEAIQKAAQRTTAYKRAVFNEFFADLRDFFRELDPQVADKIDEHFEAYAAHIKAAVLE